MINHVPLGTLDKIVDVRRPAVDKIEVVGQIYSTRVSFTLTPENVVPDSQLSFDAFDDLERQLRERIAHD